MTSAGLPDILKGWSTIQEELGRGQAEACRDIMKFRKNEVDPCPRETKACGDRGWVWWRWGASQAELLGPVCNKLSLERTLEAWIILWTHEHILWFCSCMAVCFLLLSVFTFVVICIHFIPVFLTFMKRSACGKHFLFFNNLTRGILIESDFMSLCLILCFRYSGNQTSIPWGN